MFVLCTTVAEFPSPGGNEIEPEVRTSRAAVIAPETITETLEITRSRVKKTVRLADEIITIKSTLSKQIASMRTDLNIKRASFILHHQRDESDRQSHPEERLPQSP